MFVMLFLGIPIAVAIGFAGFLGFWMLVGADAAMLKLGRVAYYELMNYAFSPIVLFVFMGEIIVFTGMGAQLFESVAKITGRMPGSLAVTTIGASALFAAICGVSTAGAMTIGQLAIPEMRKRGYRDSMATGVVAAGGTLAIMIPPSVAFVLYGIIAEESIGSLFLAGIIPGIIITLLFSAYAVIHGVRHPATLSPTSVPWREKIAAITNIVPVAILFLVVIGSIYSGVATPTEAAALGASGALTLAAVYRKLSLSNLVTACRQTALTVGLLLVIFVGALYFGYFVAMTGYIRELIDLVGSQQVPPTVIIMMIVLFLMVMGCFFDIGSMIFLTTPILLPLVKALGFSPIWYGVILVITCEMAMITPPVGMNLYVIWAIAPDIKGAEVIKGSIPFVIILGVAIALVTAFPLLATWLPGQMIRMR